MLRAWVTLFIIIMQVSLCSTAALSRFYPGRPNCPWAKSGNTWVKYLSGEYGDKDPLFSVLLIRTVANMEQKQCYTIFYQGDQMWSASGKVRDAYEGAIHLIRGGDPKEMKMNIWGEMFTFNEGGEVYSIKDGQLAGYMYCHIGDECWK